MKILLLGNQGQIGRAIYEQLKYKDEVIGLNRNQCDFRYHQQIEYCISSIKPDLIINAAAYTNVDLAEDQEDEVFQINTIAPSFLAQKANLLNIPIVHFSTDYVFDGKKEGAYLEEDLTHPLSVYARSKCEGERLIKLYQSKHFILRTSRVFSPDSDNFIKKIIRLAKEKDNLFVINDQYAAPTSAKWIAKVTSLFIEKIKSNEAFDLYGTYHIALENSISWWEYAQYIVKVLVDLNVAIKLKPSAIMPINSSDYRQKALRPLHSKLDISKVKKTFVLEFPHWRKEVENTINLIIQSSFHEKIECKKIPD